MISNKKRRCRLAIRKKISTIRVVKHWNKLPREKWWMSHLWKRSRSDRIKLWTTWSSCRSPCSFQGRLGDLSRSLLTQMILWFHMSAAACPAARAIQHEAAFPPRWAPTGQQCCAEPGCPTPPSPQPWQRFPIFSHVYWDLPTEPDHRQPQRYREEQGSKRKPFYTLGRQALLKIDKFCRKWLYLALPFHLSSSTHSPSPAEGP